MIYYKIAKLADIFELKVLGEAGDVIELDYLSQPNLKLKYVLQVLNILNEVLPSYKDNLIKINRGALITKFDSVLTDFKKIKSEIEKYRTQSGSGQYNIPDDYATQALLKLSANKDSIINILLGLEAAGMPKAYTDKYREQILNNLVM